MCALTRERPDELVEPFFPHDGMGQTLKEINGCCVSSERVNTEAGNELIYRPF